MINKVNQIKEYLCSKFIEREEIIDALFISLVAKQHTLLIGPPGTAKSDLITNLVSFIDGANYFQWLLTRFSTPEELFGPVSLSELEKGSYKRNTEGKLPEANIAFVDEIFKANSAILNSLLTLINERIFYNNGGIVHSPLISMIGASNEYPEEENLSALYDRFLLRFELDYIQSDANFFTMLSGNSVPLKKPDPLTMSELEQLQFNADVVIIPEELFEAILQIRNDLKDQGIIPSDRRFKKSLDLIKAKVALDGRAIAEFKDLIILKHGLWDEVEQKETVTQIIHEYAVDKVLKFIKQVEQECVELWDYLLKEKSYDAGTEVTAKLKQHIAELERLKNENPKYQSQIENLIQKIKSASSKIVDTILA